MKTGPIDRLLTQHPWVALLGFFPPIWIIGIPVAIVIGIRILFSDPGYFIGANLDGLGLIMGSPIWPWVLYVQYKADPAAAASDR